MGPKSNGVTKYSEKQAWLGKSSMNEFFRKEIVGEEADQYETWESKCKQFVGGLTRKEVNKNNHHLSRDTWEMKQQKMQNSTCTQKKRTSGGAGKSNA